uniref:Uncharacterized protein n=1 Tax=Salix viminalis TaxID=40686 RepID=A0A6N2K9K3_SALVM
MMLQICYCGFIALQEWQGTHFSNLNYLILIMFILNHFLEVQLLFCMELLEPIALRCFIPPWWKLPNRGRLNM